MSVICIKINDVYYLQYNQANTSTYFFIDVSNNQTTNKTLICSSIDYANRLALEIQQGIITIGCQFGKLFVYDVKVIVKDPTKNRN